MFWLGLVIALLAGVASIGASRESVKRRYPAVGDYHLDIFALAILIVGLGVSAVDHLQSERSSWLKAQVEAQRRNFAEVATWNFKGAQSISRDYSLPGPLSGWTDGYVRETADGKQVRFDDEAISHFESVLKKYPRYPFSYYFLAEAFRLKGNRELAGRYATQAMNIFRITTDIPLHSPDHDDALKNLSVGFEQGKYVQAKEK